MWTAENRPLYNRDHLRYPSDVTEAEWALIEPLITQAKHGGRRRTVDIREIVKRSDTAKGFELLPRRWIVERTIAWLNRRRRSAKDFENRAHNALAFLELASIRLTIRKPCHR